LIGCDTDATDFGSKTEGKIDAGRDSLSSYGTGRDKMVGTIVGRERLAREQDVRINSLLASRKCCTRRRMGAGGAGVASGTPTVGNSSLDGPEASRNDEEISVVRTSQEHPLDLPLTACRRLDASTMTGLLTLYYLGFMQSSCMTYEPRISQSCLFVRALSILLRNKWFETFQRPIPPGPIRPLSLRRSETCSLSRCPGLYIYQGRTSLVPVSHLAGLFILASSQGLDTTHILS
jgi:hypothetical protein